MDKQAVYVLIDRILADASAILAETSSPETVEAVPLLVRRVEAFLAELEPADEPAKPLLDSRP